jgi:hypothetical protein
MVSGVDGSETPHDRVTITLKGGSIYTNVKVVELDANYMIVVNAEGVFTLKREDLTPEFADRLPNVLDESNCVVLAAEVEGVPGVNLASENGKRASDLSILYNKLLSCSEAAVRRNGIEKDQDSRSTALKIDQRNGEAERIERGAQKPRVERPHRDRRVQISTGKGLAV